MREREDAGRLLREGECWLFIKRGRSPFIERGRTPPFVERGRTPLFIVVQGRTMNFCLRNSKFNDVGVSNSMDLRLEVVHTAFKVSILEKGTVQKILSIDMCMTMLILIYD